jgi:large subunit ribosomal protein L27Ae
MDRFHPGYFGKVGMRHFHLQKNAYHCPTVNVDQLWNLAGAEALKAAQANKDAGKAICVDVTSKGIFKVLGNGILPKIPIVVKARFVSKRAEAKIKAAGGAVVLTA